MSVQLLDKTRKINKLLHNNHSSKVVFNDICRVMTDILDADVLVISKKGKVLGMSTDTSIPKISELITDEVGGFIDGAKIQKRTARSSHRSTLPENVLERSLSTGASRILESMISL